jgi:hypothetical protein
MYQKVKDAVAAYPALGVLIAVLIPLLGACAVFIAPFAIPIGIAFLVFSKSGPEAAKVGSWDRRTTLPGFSKSALLCHVWVPCMVPCSRALRQRTRVQPVAATPDPAADSPIPAPPRLPWRRISACWLWR